LNPPNPPLGTPLPLAEMNTVIISWEKGGRGSKSGRCIGLKSLLHTYADFLKNEKPQTPGILRASNKPVQGLLNTIYVHFWYITMYGTNNNKLE
jgi:hypothetical protein